MERVNREDEGGWRETGETWVHLINDAADEDDVQLVLPVIRMDK